MQFSAIFTLAFAAFAAAACNTCTKADNACRGSGGEFNPLRHSLPYCPRIKY